MYIVKRLTLLRKYDARLVEMYMLIKRIALLRLLVVLLIPLMPSSNLKQKKMFFPDFTENELNDILNAKRNTLQPLENVIEPFPNKCPTVQDTPNTSRNPMSSFENLFAGVTVTFKVEKTGYTWTQTLVSDIVITDDCIWKHLKENQNFTTDLKKMLAHTSFSFNTDGVTIKTEQELQVEERIKWKEEAMRIIKGKIEELVKETLSVTIDVTTKENHPSLTFIDIGGKTNVVGVKDRINSFLKNRQGAKQLSGDIKEEIILTNSPKYQLLQKVRGLHAWKEKHKEIKIEFLDDEMKIVFRYSSTMTGERGTAEFKEMMDQITVLNLNEISTQKKSFLLQTDVMDYINAALQEAKLGKIFRQVTHQKADLKVIGHTYEEARRTKEAVASYVKEDTYYKSKKGLHPFGILFDKIRKDMLKNYGCRLHIYRSREGNEARVRIICTDDTHSSVDHILREKICGNSSSIAKSKIWMDNGRFQYLRRIKFADLKMQAENCNVDISMKKTLTCEDGNVCLLLYGKESDIEHMKIQINKNILAGIVTRSFPIATQETVRYLQEQGQSFCERIGKEESCVVEITDANEGLKWVVSGKHVILSRSQDLMVKDRIVVVNGESHSANELSDRCQSSTNTIQLTIPHQESGKVAADTFQRNIEQVFDELSHRYCAEIVLSVRDEYFTDEIEGDFITRILTGLQHHSKNHPNSNLKKLLLDLVSDYLINTAKAILLDFVTNVDEDEEQNYKMWCPSITITGPDARMKSIKLEQRINDMAKEGHKVVREVAGQPTEEMKPTKDTITDEKDFTTEEGYGFMKVDDSRIEVVKAKCLLDNCPQSIGLLHAGRYLGTCFRLGTCYIGTALHVIKDILDSILKIENWDNRQTCFDENVYVEFNYTRKDEQRDKIRHHLNCHPAFQSTELDFVMLELKDDIHVSLLPPRLCCTSLEPKEFNLIGHPNGDIQTLDTECRVIERNDVSIRHAKCFVENKFPGSENWYDGLDNLKFFICHTSSEPGASGSPAIIIKENKPFVVGCLSDGFPLPIFQNEIKEQRNSFPKHFMFERVTKISEIFRSIEKNEPWLLNKLGVNKYSDMDTR